MSRSRFFAPGFVAAVGSWFVAVDTVQPVAIVVSRHGDLVHVESWADQVAIPSESPWPNRRFGVTAHGLLVQDLPAGEVVSLTAEPGDSIAAEIVSPAAFDAPGVSVRYPRMFSVRRFDLPDSGEGWRLASQLQRFQFSVEVEEHGRSVPGHGLARASVVSYAQQGRAVAVCARRSNKRPWEFDPAYELHVFRTGSEGMPKSIEVAPIDISQRCWSPVTTGPELVRAMGAYMDYPMGECRAVAERGGRDVRLDLRQLESDPELELSFTLPEFPGVRLVRIDRPVNELGHLAGLRALNISLEEDLEGSDLVKALLEDVGPFDGRLQV